MQVEKISDKAQKVINDYMFLKVNGKTISTPYFINPRSRKDLRAMVGKGSPEEIIMESKIWEKIKGVNFDSMSQKEIKDFLINRGMGIDCSGFVIHVLDSVSLEKNGKHIWNYLKPRIYRKIIGNIMYKLRPVENLGAEIITNEINSKPVDINDVMPGDVIRSKAKKTNGHHIMLITEVGRDDVVAPGHVANQVVYIKYTHATPNYGDDMGVKTGEIRIKDINKPLWDQEWTEKDSHGVNHTYEGFMINVDDNGLRRLKAFSTL